MTEPMRVEQRVQGQPRLVRAEPKTQYLAFDVGGEPFAIDIRSIKEVIQYGEVTQVPLMPDFLRGVINLRGSVVPVIDLSVRFGKAPTTTSKHTCIVILEVPASGGTLDLGAIVDQVSEVLEIAPSAIEPAPNFGSSLRQAFIAGVGKVGGRFVLILDVAHALCLEELASLAGAGLEEAAAG